MGGERTTDTAVALVYQPMARDIMTAAKLQRWRTSAGRGQFAATAAALVVCAGVAAVRLLDTGSVNDGVFASLAIFGVYIGALLAFTPRMLAGQGIKLWGPLGTFHTVVDGSGIRMTSQVYAQAVAWPAVERYAETAELFVLLSRKPSAAGLVILPKRGIQEPADMDRLRGVLDERLERI
ncbi:YcxB family protein [Streptomyces sp. NPDC004726]